jgi:SulP family sulfate permease
MLQKRVAKLMTRVPAVHVIMQNIIAGLTVSFVALSLGAAFGLLSGRGAFAGMISAAIIATVTSIFGGTRVQCSGPTGPMTTITAVIVAATHDHIVQAVPGLNAEHFINLTILLTGGLLLIFGILRLGRFITYIPNVVISGFMNGIAIIIWLDQIKKLFGLGGKAAFGGPLWQNLLLTAASAILVFMLPQLTKKILPRFASLLSATFITIVVMTAIAVFTGMTVERVFLSSALKTVGDFISLVENNWPTDWSWQIIILALPFSLQLAILAYLDTLMTSLVVDKMNGEKTKPNKELMAQGLASVAVAAVGGIPGAQATIRSVLIVKEKATLRFAGVLVGVFALAEMILFQDAINLIPQAVFAGILIKVGYDVFDWLPLRLYFKELFSRTNILLYNFFSRHDDQPIFVTNREMLVIAGTMLLTVWFDLNVAVGVFTILFYLHNLLLNRANPMRDLKPATETQGFRDEL